MRLRTLLLLRPLSRRRGVLLGRRLMFLHGRSLFRTHGRWRGPRGFRTRSLIWTLRRLCVLLRRRKALRRGILGSVGRMLIGRRRDLIARRGIRLRHGMTRSVFLASRWDGIAVGTRLPRAEMGWLRATVGHGALRRRWTRWFLRALPWCAGPLLIRLALRLLHRIARRRRTNIVIGGERTRKTCILGTSMIDGGEVGAIAAGLLRVLHLRGHGRRVLLVECGDLRRARPRVHAA